MSKFYIPPCTNDVCEERLNSLSKQLSKEGYSIIEAVYSGSRAKLFKEGVEEASFTILHKCPTLWNFIKTAGLDVFLKEKQDLYDKLMCVQFDGISLGKLSDNPSSLARCETFFEDLNLQDISNDAKLQRLVQNIQAYKRKSSKNVPTSPEASLYTLPGFNYAKVQSLYENVTSQENDLRKKLMELRDEHANRLIEEDGELVWYPSQNATVKVFAKIMNGKQESTKLLNVSKLTTFEEVKDHINQVLGNSQTATCNLQFLLNKTLPEFYNHEMLYGLVVMAVCDEPNLQKQSLTRVELLVLKGKLRALDTSFEMLVVLKHILIDSIEQMRRNKTQDDVLHELIKRKCLLLYNIQIELIFKMQKPENRDMRNLSTRSEESRPAVDTYISSTQSFLGLTTEEVTQFSKEFVSVSLKTENDGNTLIGLKDYKQFYILMKQMKMLFKFNSKVNEDLLSLEYLKAYLRAKPKPKRRQHPQLCLDLIWQGIQHYLRFLSEESLNPDTTAQFLSALEIVKMLKIPNNIKQMASSLRHLMFCPDDDLRRQIIHFVQADEDLNEPWQRHVIHFIEEMFPTLKINPEDKVSSWQTLSCTFMDSQVNLTVHNDMEISPTASRMTSLGKSQGQIKIKDVEMLRSLQHENILDLYAFNLGSVPEFFITEQLCEKHDQNVQ
ncbi:Abelson tyrosine-protein kinase 2, partial [Biomphalaria glabrata]